MLFILIEAMYVSLPLVFDAKQPDSFVSLVDKLIQELKIPFAVVREGLHAQVQDDTINRSKPHVRRGPVPIWH
jgi:hypothetical protein